MNSSLFEKFKKFVFPAFYIAAAAAICLVLIQIKREVKKTAPEHSQTAEFTDGGEISSVEYNTEVSPGYVDYIPTDKTAAVQLMCEKLNIMSVENRTKTSIDKSVEFTDVNLEIAEKGQKLKTISDAVNKYMPDAEYDYSELTGGILTDTQKLASPQDYNVIMSEDAVLTLSFNYGKAEAQKLCDPSAQFFISAVQNDLKELLTVKDESVYVNGAQVIAHINEHSGLLYSFEVAVNYICICETSFSGMGMQKVSFNVTERTIYAFEREGIYFADKKVVLSHGDDFVFRVDIHLPAGYENEPYDLTFRSSAPDILRIDPVSGKATALAVSEESLDVVAILSFKNRLKVYQDICEVSVKNAAP